jgi:hypothetical protein
VIHETASEFTRDGFEVWVDHFQYLDLGERHQSVPSGRSYIRGKFDPEQDAYVINKIHIDPDMLRTDVKAELLDEAKLQAHKRDKKLFREKRVAAMPKQQSRPNLRIVRDQPDEERPMITRDLQTAVWRVADSLARSLKDPQGATPGDARWTVSGLSHSSWTINHPDILTDGESPLTLRIKKLPDGRWVAFGQNRLTNLLNTKILAIKKTPPGGDDWEDIDTFSTTAADYFQEQKESILSLKQSMTPKQSPGVSYGGQQQQGGDMGGMGGGMGGMGMAASRGARRRKAEIEHGFHNGNGNVLPTKGQGATAGNPDTMTQVNQHVQGVVSEAVNKASRLQQGISTASSEGTQFSRQATRESLGVLSTNILGAAKAVKWNLGTKIPQAQALYRQLMAGYTLLQKAAAGVNENALQEIIANLNQFVRIGNAMLQSTKPKQSSRRASATLDNLRKAQRLARQIHRTCEDQDWYLGTRVINDKYGIGLGIGARDIPPRSLRSSLGGIPVILEGPGGRKREARQKDQKHLRLARNLCATGLHRVAQEVAEGLGVDTEAEKALKHHQRLVKRVYNHIKNSKRLSGSVRYLSRKLGIDFNDLVRVIGQLIVEGKIEMTKKKKFKPLPEPHTPVPGMESKFASTNSVFGIDRGRSDKRVDQLLSQSNFQLNMNEPADATHRERDIREKHSKIMPDPTMPN